MASETIWPISRRHGTDRGRPWRNRLTGPRPQTGRPMPGHDLGGRRFHARVATPPDGSPPPRLRRPFPATRPGPTGWPSWCHRRPWFLVLWPPAASALAPMFSNGSFKLDFLGDVTPSLERCREQPNFFSDPDVLRPAARLVTFTAIGKGIHAAAPEKARDASEKTDQFGHRGGLDRPWAAR